MWAPRIYPSLPGSTPFYCDHMKCIRLPESTPPSQNIPPLFNNYMRPSQNIPLPPRIYSLFNKCMCDPTLPESPPPPPEYIPFSTTIILCGPSRIYPFPESTPLFNQFMCATTTICDPPRIHPSPQNIPLFQQLYATFPESTPPSQNIGLPSFSTNLYMRPSHNLPLLPRIYPLFNKCMCDPHRIYPPSQNIPPFSTTTCDCPRIYPSLPEYTPFSTTIILCDPPRIYPSLSESTHLFNQFMCATLPVCDVRCPCL